MRARVRRLFIVGVGRSGTSLLQSMLASNRKIVMMPETGFIRRYLFASRPWRKRAVKAAFLKQDRYLSRWENDGAMNIRSLNDEQPIIPEKLYQDVSSHYAQNKSDDVEYVADKDPRLIEVLPLLDRVFSDYKVVHIYRDPRDVLLSKNQAEWSKHHSMWKNLIANNAQMRLFEIFLRSHRQSVFEVKYETLLEKPAHILRQICDFLEIEFSEDMLNFQEQAKQLVSADELSWKKETTGPLLTNNMYKWKSQMKPEDAFRVEKSCHISMQKGGYEHVQVAISQLQRIKCFMSRLLVDFVSIIYVYKSRYFPH